MGTQEPGSKRVTFQHLALVAPLLLLSLRLDPSLFIFYSCSLALSRFLSSPPPLQSLHTSLPNCPLRFVPPLIFQHIHFILGPYSPSEVSPERKPHPSPLFCFQRGKWQSWKEGKNFPPKKEQENKELEFSYGIE